MGKAIFVTGTGTDVGKTYVTGLLVKKIRDAGLDGSYYKAALSGAEPDGQGNLVPGDAAWVKETAGLKDPLTDLVTYVYQEAVSPPSGGPDQPPAGGTGNHPGGLPKSPGAA